MIPRRKSNTSLIKKKVFGGVSTYWRRRMLDSLQVSPAPDSRWIIFHICFFEC